jgi:uncharacterized membrane protein
VLALVGIGVLILFIHHIATSIQASNIICSVADETITAIERMFPENPTQASDEEDEACLANMSLAFNLDWHMVSGITSGYIESVDYAALRELARKRNIIIKMNYGIGNFIVKDMALASIARQDPPDEEMVQELRSFYSIGSRRTIEQDPEFGIRQIVDIALKALSPGINDTTTAVTCVDYLTTILCYLAPRNFPSRIRYEEGKRGLITAGTTFVTLVEVSFDQIRRSAKGNVTVMTHMLSALEVIATRTTGTHRREALRKQVQWIAELAHRSVESPHDLMALDAQLESVRALMSRL